MEHDQENTVETTGKPVVINAENGSVVTVNVNVKNFHYGYPQWFDQAAFDLLIEAIKGR